MTTLRGTGEAGDEVSGDVEGLADILRAHRVEQLGFPGAVKCHACDDWTEGTIYDHHADLARAFFAAERDRAVAEALAPVRALAAMCPLDPAVPHQCSTLIAAHDLHAALPDESVCAHPSGERMFGRCIACGAALPAEPTGEGT